MVSVARHTKQAEFRCQCVIGEITVQPKVLAGFWIGFPYLYYSIGQHGFKILLRFIAEAEIPRSVGLLVLLIDNAVDGHTGAQDMISHEHVHNIERIRIVFTCADLDAFLVDVVVPSTAIAVPFCAFCFEVVKVVNTSCTEYIVGLSKDRPLDHTLFGIIEWVAIAVIVIGSQIVSLGSTVRIILAFYQERIGITGLFECFIEDAQIFLTLHT